MTVRQCVVFILSIVLVDASARAQTRPSESALSVDDVRTIFEQQEYSQAIRQATRLLAIKSTSQNDRYELLVLKAESHLRLGDATLAAKAFDEAQAVASDATSAAKARAMGVLIRRCKRDQYQAKISPDGSLTESYPIVEADGRKLALKALYSDERAACEKRLASAVQSSDLTTLCDGLDAAMLLNDLELAAMGDDTESQARLKPLAERADEALEEQLKKAADRVNKLQKEANKKKKMGSVFRKRGLADEEKTELRAHAEACTKLSEAAWRFAAVSSKPEGLNETAREAQELIKLIDDTLRADYTKLYDRN